MINYSSIDSVVYDLDGTIVDSAPIHAAAWRTAANQFDINVNPEFLEFQKGRTNEEAAEHLLNPLGKLAILQDLVSAKVEYAGKHAGESHYFEDFTVAYERLRHKGIQVWICTSSPKLFCLKVYETFDELKDFAERTVWREMYRGRKDQGLKRALDIMSVAPKNAVYVGDAPSDWEAAQEVGCLFVCYRGLAIDRHNELLPLLP